MTALNYYETLITVPDDCPVSRSTVPEAKGGKKTVAVIQYEMLAGHPYVHTQEDLLFESWLARQELPGPVSEAERARLRSAFFARPQACLRGSPLPKRYGWGLRFDREGRVALCPMESREYEDLATGRSSGVKVLQALRTSRAQADRRPSTRTAS